MLFNGKRKIQAEEDPSETKVVKKISIEKNNKIVWVDADGKHGIGDFITIFKFWSFCLDK